MRKRIALLTAQDILALCVIGGILRLVFVFLYQPSIPVAEDVNIAQHLASGQGFSIYTRGPTSIKGPFYPAYLALWLWLLGEQNGLLAAVVLQHVVMATMPWWLFRLGQAIGREELGKGAAVLFALHPSYFYHPTVAENTTWIVVGGAVWGVLLFQGMQSRYWRLLAVVLGALLGVFILEKPPLVLPMLGALLLRLRRRGTELALALGAAAAVVIPWMVRGWVVFGEPTVTKSYSAYLTFIHSWLPSMAVHPRYAVADSVGQVLDSLTRLPESNALPALRALAGDILQQRWWQLPERTLVHAVVYWTIPPRYWHAWSMPFIVVRVIPVAVLIVLFVWGAILLWKYDRQLVLAIGGVLGAVTAFYAFYHVLNIRYKLEIEWLQLLVCAAPICRVSTSRIYCPCHMSNL